MMNYQNCCWVLRHIRAKRLFDLTAICTHRNRLSNLYCTSVSRETRDWELPGGTDTGIKIYNTLTRSKVPLKLPTEGNLKWYVCGPTVYDEPHVGHACSYVRLDTIRRILNRVFNINIVYMMNLTDIDDKLINKANQTGQPVMDIARHYESRFLQALNRLNVLQPTITHRVTDHMPSIVRFIEKLIEDGNAYVTDDGNVFFHCSQYAAYCNLSKNKDVSNFESQIGTEGKLDRKDFALWKSKKPNEPFWESPWGAGRPGWHIECSAMASEVFGERIDIHSGGSDLIFPHHENELAQSNCYHHTNQWVNYWLHTGLLKSRDHAEKMSKSLGNVVSIDDLLDNYTANQFRLFCLLSHYNQNLEYSNDAMKRPVVIHQKLKGLKSLAESYIQGSSEARSNHCVNDELLLKSLTMAQKTIRDALADDFDTRTMMTAVMGLVHVSNIELSKTNPKKVIKARCVHSVAAVMTYIEDLMSDMGICISHQSSDVGGGDMQQMSYILDSVTSFRDKVRDFSLGGVVANATAEQKAEIKAHRKAHSSLLTSCDQLRDELSTLANIDIKDGKGNKSRWEVRVTVGSETDTQGESVK